MRTERAKLPRSSPHGQADRLYAPALGPLYRFIEDGRICLTNNAAERALRGFALGRNRGCSPAPNAALTGRRPWRR